MWLVRWYGRYALSYNDLKEMAAERGLKVERSALLQKYLKSHSVAQRFKLSASF